MGRPGLAATVRVLSLAFFRKIVTRHDTGLGEAYMDGDYEVSRLNLCYPRMLLIVCPHPAKTVRMCLDAMAHPAWNGLRKGVQMCRDYCSSGRLQV